MLEIKRSGVSLFFVLLLSNTVMSADKLGTADVRQILENRVRVVQKLAGEKSVIDAVNKQNAAHLKMEDVMVRDETWKASGPEEPFKQNLLKTQAGRLLTLTVDNSSAVYSEAMIIDRNGVIVSAYPPSSDYFQGDEDKYITPFLWGDVYYGPLEFDESSQSKSAQLGVPIKNEHDQIIGVLVVGLRETYLRARIKGY